jgi:late competence protein required for DNA uptake (superfamily II DNA/RNA helicase)
VVIEVLTAILVAALGLASLVAAYIGLLSLAGAVRQARCQRCGHLAVTSASGSPGGCIYCRHDHLMHPIRTLRPAHSVPGSQRILGHGS